MKAKIHQAFVWPLSRWLLGVVLLLALAIITTGRAVGHGGGAPQIVNEPAGPYLVSAWTDPDPLRVGTIHMTVAVSEPAGVEAAAATEAGTAVLGAAVRVVLESMDNPTIRPVGGLATHENAINRLFYEADLDVPETGIWRVNLLIDGPAGAGETGFEVQVLPPSRLNWPILVAAAAVVLVAAVLVQISGRSRPPRNDSH
jgi:hypothetical protein